MLSPEAYMSAVQRWMENNRVFTVLMGVIPFVFLVATYISNEPDDIVNYYNQATQILSGRMPYSDVPFEYPPFAMVFFILPALVSWDIGSYRAAYAVMVYIALFFLVYYSYKVADRCQMEMWKVNLLMVTFVLVGMAFVVARYDVFPVVMITISLWLYLDKRYKLAFAVMALACMTKVYPGVLLIPMLVPFLMRREWRNFFTGFLVFALVCLIVELPFIINDPSTAFAYLTYHSDRGLQVEAVVSSFLMTAALIVPTDISIVHNYGSHNLVGALPDAIAPFMNIIMVAALLLFVLVIMYRLSKSERARENPFPIVGVMCLAMVMIFIMFSKVYSAQYILWIIPLVLFAILPSIGLEHRKELTMLFAPFCVFTVLGSVSYMLLVEFSGIAVLFELVKNVLHIILTLEVVHLCLYETRPDEKTDMQERSLFGCLRRKSAE